MSVFTPDEVVSLNDYQKAGVFHPFTCGSGNRTDEHHLDGEGILIATEQGWICPYCDYTQQFVHVWMKDRSWEKPFKLIQEMHAKITKEPNLLVPAPSRGQDSDPSS